MTDHTVREVAESLLSSVTAQPYRQLGHNVNHSVNMVNEDWLAGHRADGRMSAVRRFFCLFVTFDLLFTSLMWLICVMMRGETIRQIFEREIVNYDIKTSLVDIVLVAVVRFIFLITFYGIIYINNWSVIALSTSVTCAFLISKVFVYDWPDAAQPVYQVFLILSSFTLAWGEAWFLDFRVLPQEMQAQVLSREPCERSPLLAPQQTTRRSVYAESSVNWFSPVNSPIPTPRPPPGQGGGGEVTLTTEQIEEYKRLADESMASAFRVVTLGGWRLEKRGSVKGDVVESTTTEPYGKVYRFTGIVDCPPEFLFKEFKENITRLPEWNPTILRSEVIKDIGDGVDLSYQVTAGGGRGIISPRDFVILRRTAALARDGSAAPTAPYCYISSGVSVQVPGYPPTAHMVRGHNKVGCWCLKPTKVRNSEGKEETKTVFQWLMCCDLKGKIPQFVLDTAFATVMLDYIVHVRRFVADCKTKGMF